MSVSNTIQARAVSRTRRTRIHQINHSLWRADSYVDPARISYHNSHRQKGQLDDATTKVRASALRLSADLALNMHHCCLGLESSRVRTVSS